MAKAAVEAKTALSVGTWLWRNHPPDNHDCGIANSAHPQSAQTSTSGLGVSGG